MEEKDLEKAELIKQIINAQQNITRTLVPRAMDSWRKLEVPLAQLKSLFIIANRGDINFRNLASDLDVTPGNVTGIVDRLVEQGLVSRDPDPEDRRFMLLRATDKGRALLTGLMETHNTLTSKILDRMSLDDLNALLQGLNGLARALEE